MTQPAIASAPLRCVEHFGPQARREPSFRPYYIGLLAALVAMGFTFADAVVTDEV
jgi:hypothetical protein